MIQKISVFDLCISFFFFFHLQNIIFNFCRTYSKMSKAKLSKHASVSAKRYQFTSTGHRQSRTVLFCSTLTNQHLIVVLAFIKHPTKKLAFQGKAGGQGTLAYRTMKAIQSCTRSQLFCQQQRFGDSCSHREGGCKR